MFCPSVARGVAEVPLERDLVVFGLEEEQPDHLTPVGQDEGVACPGQSDHHLFELLELVVQGVVLVEVQRVVSPEASLDVGVRSGGQLEGHTRVAAPERSD